MVVLITVTTDGVASDIQDVWTYICLEMSPPARQFTAVLELFFKRFDGKHWVATCTGTAGLLWTTDPSPELLRLTTVIWFPCSLFCSLLDQRYRKLLQISNTTIKYITMHMTKKFQLSLPSLPFMLHCTNHSSKQNLN